MKHLPKLLLRYRHLIMVFILMLISLYLDNSISGGVLTLRTDIGNQIMIFVTQIETLWIFFILLFIPYLISPKYRDYLFAIWGSAAFALITAFILKNLFLADRPQVPTLTNETTPGFPSMHAALVFSALPIVINTIKKLTLPWTILAFLIAFSRIYVGVHYLSDVLGGIAIGLASGEIFLWLEKKHNLAKRILNIHFELRRQIAHMATGTIIALGLHANLLDTKDIALMFIGGTILMLLYKRYPDKIPVITPMLIFFERKKDRINFPGRGSFFLILGILLSLLVFPKEIAITAIIILAVGDSVTNIAGRYFGQWENPLNPKKTIEGSMVGFICALGAASLFMSFWPAFFACIGAMFLESIPFKFSKFEIDDNIIIPLTSGWILTLWFA